MLESVALPLVKWALSEDVGTGDITTLNTLRPGVGARAVIMVKQPGVVAGLEVARLTFRELDASLRFVPMVADWTWIEAGVDEARGVGFSGSILTCAKPGIYFLTLMS